MKCYRCHQPGHFADDCPQVIPAASPDEHKGRIQQAIDLWADGSITLMQKRRMIADENRLYYGDDCRPKLLVIH